MTSDDPERIAKQYNFEYRAAEAAASPYLALAAIVHARCQGIEDELTAPQVTDEDLSLLSPQELEEKGYVRLPESLNEALERFEDNKTVCSWFPTGFSSVYAAHKRGEMQVLEGMDETARCAAYEDVY